MDVGGEIRVLIAAADALVLAGLRALVDAEPGMHVVGELNIGVHTSPVPLATGPDVILCDLGRDATAIPERLAALEAFGLPILALLPDSTQRETVLGAGARGVLRREAGGERIAAALTAVAAGLQVSEPPARGHDELLDRRPAPPAEELTPRETEVLQLMAEGLSNKAIARRLRISEHTVKFHVTAVMGKLDVHSRTEAVTRAARLGLIIL